MMMRLESRSMATMVLPLLWYLMAVATTVESYRDESEVAYKPSSLRRTQQFFQLPPEDSEWQECVDQLYESDVNENLELGEVEYTLFIATRTRGQILVDQYRNLPFSLISCFVFGACFCGVFSFTPDCCVGDDARIELDTESSAFIADNLITLCRSVDDAILQEIGTLSPISLPPVEQPTEAPAATLTPSMVPTDATITLSPSMLPSDVLATMMPTRVESALPSETPTIEPSMAPSFVNSSAPTMLPSGTPSSTPTVVGSNAPSFIPTMETAMPTPEALTCVSFQYGIQNNAGFDSQAIFNEVNNTLKTGLIIATENVTIEILNASFPRDGEADPGAESRRRAHRTMQRNIRQLQGLHGLVTSLMVDHEHDATTGYLDTLNAGELGRRRSNDVQLQGHRQAAYLPKSLDSTGSDKGKNRRLVFYTDEFEPVINTIFDNPFCEEPDGVICSIVDSTVCVVLEEGDDEAEVQATLLAGIGEAIQDGSFEAAIPPENQLPGGETVAPEEGS